MSGEVVDDGGVAAGAAKLAEMLARDAEIPAGRTFTTAAGNVQPVPHTLASLNDPANVKGLYAKDPAVQAAAVRELNQLLAPR